MAKPKCALCEEKESLSKLLGGDMMKDLMYGMFDRENMPESGQQTMDLEDFLKKFMNEDEWRKYQAGKSEANRYMDMMNYFYPYFSSSDRHSQDHKNVDSAKQKAWRELVRRLRQRQLSADDLDAKELMEHFQDQLMEEFEREGYMEDSFQDPLFSPKGEKMIAERVLDDVFSRLEKVDIGSHEVYEGGVGTYPSHLLTDYDEWQHPYDALDLQETLLKTARRDPAGMDFETDDFRVRIPIHKAKASTVIAIDKSTSMSWSQDKIKGAIKAALGLRELLETEYKDDELHIIAYDHEPHPLKSGEIASLGSRTGGWTDIGLALDFSRELLEGADGNKNVVLITDGWPTASSYPQMTPAESALRGSLRLGLEDIRLVVVMLNTHPGLRRLCQEMANLNGNATIAYVDDPGSLKEFMIQSYVKDKRGTRA
ncbi:MAG: VWA domain-containing protein [Euryarchaeota archaeon]|nr:VWA domain-containing protein [Euryarchaeota archaeon]